VNSEVRLLRTPTFDLDYRLCRCEGFRVDSPEGRVGVVQEAHFRSRIDRPDALVVRTGLLGRLLMISVEEVAEVSLGEERVVLVRAPQQNENALSRQLRNLVAGAAKSGRARDWLPGR
jgi:hypothetical protein